MDVPQNQKLRNHRNTRPLTLLLVLLLLLSPLKPRTLPFEKPRTFSAQTYHLESNAAIKDPPSVPLYSLLGDGFTVPRVFEPVIQQSPLACVRQNNSSFLVSRVFRSLHLLFFDTPATS